MQDLLYSYLIQNGSLGLPGIGTIFIKRISAQGDFVNQRMMPPSAIVQLDPSAQPIRSDLFNYIARKEQLDQVEAIRMLNEFSFNLRGQLKGGTYEWKGIGVFAEAPDGTCMLSSSPMHFDFLQPVNVERVVHRHSEHYIKVGDKEKTNTQMAEWLQERDSGKKFGWVTIALIISLLTTSMFALNYIRIVPSFIPEKASAPRISSELK